jgi:hypothetical protein
MPRRSLSLAVASPRQRSASPLRSGRSRLRRTEQLALGAASNARATIPHAAAGSREIPRCSNRTARRPAMTCAVLDIAFAAPATTRPAPRAAAGWTPSRSAAIRHRRCGDREAGSTRTPAPEGRSGRVIYAHAVTRAEYFSALPALVNSANAHRRAISFN